MPSVDFLLEPWTGPLVRWTLLGAVVLLLLQLIPDRRARLRHNCVAAALLSLPVAFLLSWTGLLDQLYSAYWTYWAVPDINPDPSGILYSIVRSYAIRLHALQAGQLWLGILGSIWLLGSAAFCLPIVSSWWATARVVQNSLDASPDLNRYARSLLDGRKVRVVISGGTPTPFVVGVWRPLIVLPQEDEDSRLVIRHEVAHIKSGDVAIGWGLLLLRVTFWLHPLVWFGQRSASLARELDCDSFAVADESRAEYARVLCKYSIPGTVTTAAFASPVSALKVRLKHLGSERSSRRSSGVDWLLAAILFGVLTLATAFQTPREPLSVVFNNDVDLEQAEEVIAETLGGGYPVSSRMLRPVRVVASFDADPPRDRLRTIADDLGAQDVVQGPQPAWACKAEQLLGQHLVTFLLPSGVETYGARLAAEEAGLRVCEIWKDPNLVYVLGLAADHRIWAAEALLNTGLVAQAGIRAAADSLGRRAPSTRVMEEVQGHQVPVPSAWASGGNWAGGTVFHTPGNRAVIWLGQEFTGHFESGTGTSEDWKRWISQAAVMSPEEATGNRNLWGHWGIKDGRQTLKVQGEEVLLRLESERGGTKLLVGGKRVFVEAIVQELSILFRNIRRIRGEDEKFRLDVVPSDSSRSNWGLIPPEVNPFSSAALGDLQIHWANKFGLKSTFGNQMLIDASRAGFTGALTDGWYHSGWPLLSTSWVQALDPTDSLLLMALENADPAAIELVSSLEATEELCSVAPLLLRVLPTEEELLENEPGRLTSAIRQGTEDTKLWRVPEADALRKGHQRAIELVRSGRLLPDC